MLTELGYLVPATMSLQSLRISSVRLGFLLALVAYLAAITNAKVHRHTFVVSWFTQRFHSLFFHTHYYGEKILYV